MIRVRSEQIPSYLLFGAERSGTTLLAFLLSGQPDTVCINDSFVFARMADAQAGPTPFNAIRGARPSTFGAVRAGGIRGGYAEARNRVLATTGALTASEEVRFFELLESQYRRQNDWYQFLTLYAEPLARARHRMSPGPHDRLELIADILRELALLVDPDISSPVIGEKTPSHTLLAPWLLQLLPGIKAILLVRDPITNVASIYKRHRPLKSALALYGRFVPFILWLASRPGVQTVSYRALLAQPVETMRSVVSFLGLDDFDPTLPMKPFGKERYTGYSVDPAREPDPDSVLDPVTRSKLRTRYQRIYDLIDVVESTDRV